MELDSPIMQGSGTLWMAPLGTPPPKPRRRRRWSLRGQRNPWAGWLRLGHIE